ncbi:MAG: hypothetical protein ACP5JG_05025 [Anaerolineae bacterium]
MSDYSKVCIEGDANQIDSFVACIAAVLHAWERPIGYDWIAGLSGIAFAPMLDPGEDCAAWWMESGSDLRIVFLGRALGFHVDRVTRDAPWDDAARRVYRAEGLLPPPHESHFARLRAALDHGDAVVLRTWPAWTVLTGWAKDVDQLPFATLPGFAELVGRIWGPAKAQLAYLLGRTSPELSPEDALDKALRFGSRVAAGRGPDPSLHYGPALYAAAAAKLEEGAFCSSCGVDADGCAHRTLMRMFGTQRSAVGFLEAGRALVGEDLPWAEAIAAFDEMIQITSSYCNWEAFQEDWQSEGFRDSLKEDFESLATLQMRAAEALELLATAYSKQYIADFE